MKLDKWKSQLVRGILEYSILLILEQQTYYGYEILQKLNNYPIISSTESTVYPLLRRLQKEGYLTSTWQESAAGVPPRKYYVITEQGLKYLDAMKNEWHELVQTIDKLKENH